MQVKQAKEYFEMGVIKGFSAARTPMDASTAWVLTVHGKDGRDWLLHTQLGKVKEFVSLDTLVFEVTKITGRVSSLEIRT